MAMRSNWFQYCTVLEGLGVRRIDESTGSILDALYNPYTVVGMR